MHLSEAINPLHILGCSARFPRAWGDNDLTVPKHSHICLSLPLNTSSNNPSKIILYVNVFLYKRPGFWSHLPIRLLEGPCYTYIPSQLSLHSTVVFYFYLFFGVCVLYDHMYGSTPIHSMFTGVTGVFQGSCPIPLHHIPSRQSFSLNLKLGWQPASPSNVLLVPSMPHPEPTCFFMCLMYTGTQVFSLYGKHTLPTVPPS